MKNKKILIVFCAVCLVIATTVVTFAATVSVVKINNQIVKSTVIGKDVYVKLVDTAKVIGVPVKTSGKNSSLTIDTAQVKKDVKITYNGSSDWFTDKGAMNAPLLYKGAYYIPLSFIKDAGLTAVDTNKSAIRLGESKEKFDVYDIFKLKDSNFTDTQPVKTKDPNMLKAGDTVFQRGIEVNGPDVGSFNTDKKFTTLELDMFSTKEQPNMIVSNENKEVLARVNFDKPYTVSHVKVNITGSSAVFLNVELEKEYAHAVIANMYVY